MPRNSVRFNCNAARFNRAAARWNELRPGGYTKHMISGFMRSLGACILLAAAMGSGCAATGGKPVMHSAQILPTDLKPGDTAIITVQVDDKFGIVRKVEGIVKEDRTIKFNFTDNGVAPDAEAGDTIWTIQVDVPFNAPPGTFEFEVTGYDGNGEVIVIDDENGEAAPLSTSFKLDIRYPDEPSAGSPGTP